MDGRCERRAGFLIVTDAEGLRHAIRVGAVIGIHEVDVMGDDVVVQLPGGRGFTVQASLDQVIDWFDAGGSTDGRRRSG